MEETNEAKEEKNISYENKSDVCVGVCVTNKRGWIIKDNDMKVERRRTRRK